MTATESLPTNNPQGQIHAELAAILDELPAIGKDSTNDHLNFRFRGIEALVNALNPLLGKHGVVTVPHSTDLLRWEAKQKGYAAVVKVTYRLTARDGSWVQAEGIGEGHDFGDKAVPKATSIAEKMMLGHTFLVAFEDQPDPDGTTTIQDDKTPAASTPPAGARRERPAQGTGPAAPPASEDPDPPARTLAQRNQVNFTRVKALPVAELNALKAEMAEKKIPMDFSGHTEEQCAWVESKTADF